MDIRCSIFIATSLDGFIARRDGAIDWLTDPADVDASEDYGYKAFIDSVDTLVMGRKTYELALTFKEWPYAGKKVVVLSSGSPNVPENLSGSVEIMSGQPAELVRRLAQRGARHVCRRRENHPGFFEGRADPGNDHHTNPCFDRRWDSFVW
jgi:dihydrofolate reductase